LGYLLDTNHCVYLMNGANKPPSYQSEQERRTVQAALAAPAATLFLSEASLGELYYGAARSNDPDRTRGRIDALKRITAPLAVTERIWRIFGESKAQLRQAGIVLTDLDLVIACTAQAHSLTLVSNDSAFQHLPPAFSVENWAG
jgi:tRNA(fMet)-specific endonuclease VapC